MDQVADIIGLPHLDDSDVHEGVQRAKVQRNNTVSDLHEFDVTQTAALSPIETDLATMESWLANIESLFTDSTTTIEFKADHWTTLSAENTLKTELAHKTAEMVGVGMTDLGDMPNLKLNALLANQNRFRLISESIDETAAPSLYKTHIYTTIPGMAFRTRLKKDSSSEDELGFMYPFKKSWRSFKEIGSDAIDGFKERGKKSFDTPYDFVNHGTFGLLDGIWSGAKDRSEKKFNSPSNFLNYLTVGTTEMVGEALNPDDPYSKEHWLNSFGLAASVTGIGKVSTSNPVGSVSSPGKLKETAQSTKGITNKSTTDNFGKHSTYIDNKVKVVDKVDLPDWISESFVDGNYRTVITKENILVYRTFGGNARVNGSFVTTSPAWNRINAKVNTALVPDWKNSRQFEAVIEVPEGQILNIGRVERQFTKTGALLKVNGDQILLPQGWSKDWIKETREVPSR